MLFCNFDRLTDFRFIRQLKALWFLCTNSVCSNETGKFIVPLNGNSDSSTKIHTEILRFRFNEITNTKTFSLAAQSTTWSSHFVFKQDLLRDKPRCIYFPFLGVLKGGNFTYYD